ncbi:hypothetical protein LPJ61_003472, partial [Coemansia biformis]
MLNVKWRLVAIVVLAVVLVHLLVRSPYIEMRLSGRHEGANDALRADGASGLPADNAPANLKHPPPVTVTVTHTVAQAETVTSGAKGPVLADNDAPGSRPERASAAFVILTRNRDLKDLRESLAQLEDRFNRRYNYPYVFLNNEPFSDDFKEQIGNV